MTILSQTSAHEAPLETAATAMIFRTVGNRTNEVRLMKVPSWLFGRQVVDSRESREGEAIRRRRNVCAANAGYVP